MHEWPSIVPGAPEGYYIVVNHYGRFGAAAPIVLRAKVRASCDDFLPRMDGNLKIVHWLSNQPSYWTE